MSIEVDDLIREVAARYGIVITVDDPIIAAVALNDVILDQHTARLEAAHKVLTDHIAEISDSQIQRSRQIAQTIVGEALKVATRDIEEQAKAAAESAAAGLETRINEMSKELIGRSTLHRRLAVAWSIAGVSLITLLITWVIILRPA